MQNNINPQGVTASFADYRIHEAALCGRYLPAFSGGKIWIFAGAFVKNVPKIRIYELQILPVQYSFGACDGIRWQMQKKH